MRRYTMFSSSVLGSVFLGLVLNTVVFAEDEKPTAIEEIKRTDAVDFEKEILPIFRRNCLACHNSTEAESDLVLETPASILKGGSDGPSVVAGKGADSLLLKLAARQQESFMPPDDNTVGAKSLSPQELGLIKLWIDQGAKGEVKGISGAPDWQPLPAGVNPIYSVTISPDGQYVAAGRANQVFIYHAPSKREVGRLTDPTLLNSEIYDRPGVAFFDVVQSLGFSPDGQYLAAGGYRTVKIFRRPRNVQRHALDKLESAAHIIATSADGRWVAFGLENGKVRLSDLATGRVSVSLSGHTAAVKALAFSADGSKLVSGSADKTVLVWNVQKFAQDGPALATPSPVNGVALVSEGKQIATAGDDNLIRVWNMPGEGVDNAQPQREIKGHGGPVHSLVSVQANGSQLLSGSQDGTVRLWNVADGKQLRSMNHGGPVVAVSVRPDFAKFVSASANNTAKLWNAADGKEVAVSKGSFRARLTVEELKRTVDLAKIREDKAKGDLDAANKRKEAEDKNLKTAQDNTKKATEELAKKVEATKKPAADKVAADKVLTDGQAAQKKAEADQKTADANMKKAEADLKKSQAAFKVAEQAVVDAGVAGKVAATTLASVQAAAKAAPKNKSLAELVVSVTNVVKQAQEQSKKVESEKAKAQKAVTDMEAAKKAADDAKKKADETLTKANADLKAAQETQKKATEAAQKATNEKNAAQRTLEANQKTEKRAGEAVVKAQQGIAEADKLHKGEQGKHKQAQGAHEKANAALPATEKPLHSVAFSHDGKTFALAGDDQQVHTFESETGAPVESYEGHGAAVTAVGFAKNGDLISAAKDNSVILWNGSPQWELVRTIGNPDDAQTLVDRVTAVGFSRSGKLLATGGGEPSRSGQLKLWDVETGKLVREIKEPHSDTIFAVEFSPEDDYIASCGADRFMKVFKVADGEFVRSFEGHTHHVLGVSWSADGRTLATCGADKVIKIWTFKTGDQQRTIGGFSKELTSIKFVSIGTNVVASCGDNNVHVKRADNGGNIRALGGGKDFMYSTAVSGDGKTFVGGGQDSVLRIWNDQGQALAAFGPPEVAQPEAESGGE